LSIQLEESWVNIEEFTKVDLFCRITIFQSKAEILLMTCPRCHNRLNVLTVLDFGIKTGEQVDSGKCNFSY